MLPPIVSNPTRHVRVQGIGNNTATPQEEHHACLLSGRKQRTLATDHGSATRILGLGQQNGGYHDWQLIIGFLPSSFAQML